MASGFLYVRQRAKKDERGRGGGWVNISINHPISLAIVVGLRGEIQKKWYIIGKGGRINSVPGKGGGKGKNRPPYSR